MLNPALLSRQLSINAHVEAITRIDAHLDEMVRKGLAASKDPREVVADPHGRYYGIEMEERTLVPDDGAKLGKTRFEDWLAQSGAKNGCGEPLGKLDTEAVLPEKASKC